MSLALLTIEFPFEKSFEALVRASEQSASESTA